MPSSLAPRRPLLAFALLVSALAPAATPPRGRAVPPAVDRLVHRLERGADDCRASRRTAVARKQPSRASANVEATSYTIDLALDPAVASMTGSCEVGLKATQAGVAQLSLDLVGLTVSSVLEQGTTPVAFQQVGGELQITPSSPMALDEERSFLIAYGGVPQRGMNFVSDNQGTAFTFAEPYDARYWYPCRDLPEDKADWYRGRMTVPAGYLVASNGDLVSVTGNGDGTETHEYFHDFPIATYLISFAVSHYATFTQTPGTGTPIKNFVFPAHLQEAMYDFANLPAMMDFYATDYWPYPFPTYGMAIAPLGGGMEHQTMTTMDPRIVTGQRTREGILAHELAHHWWGDMITCREFKDIWLNEGFATYFDALFSQDFYGDAEFRDEMADNRFIYFLYEPYEGRFPIYDPSYLWGVTVYEKGSWALHMLRHRIGAPAFVDVMRAWATAYQYDVATTADLLATAETSTGLDLDPYFDQWIYGAGYPELRVSWVPQATSVDVRVDQVQAITPTTGLFDVTLELDVVTSAGSVSATMPVNAATQTMTVNLPAPPQRVVLDPGLKLLFKVTGLDGLVAAPGPSASNASQMLAVTPSGAPLGPAIAPYASGWGASPGTAELDDDVLDPRQEILSGPGPGPVYGPHVRAFRTDGTTLAKVSFYAYGTLRYGVNPSGGDVDDDGYDEIVTGPGPGAVFGPHVRGFQVDGGAPTAMPGLSFYAYSTLKYGTNVAPGSIDADAFAEIVTGAGPGTIFGPHVRGFDFDGGPSPVAIGKVNFFAFATTSYGVNVTTGDLDLDGRHEMVAGLGPGPTFGSQLQGFDYDVAITALPGVAADFLGTLYGSVVGTTDEDGDGADGVISAAGPDPSAPSLVLLARVDETVTAREIYGYVLFGGTSHGARVAGGRLDR